MDLKNILTDEEKSKIKQSNSNEKYKKPIQLRDIDIHKSSITTSTTNIETNESMKTLLNLEKKEILKQSWNKLDTGLKIARLKIFIEKEKEEKELNDDTKEQLRKILFDACRGNKLNKNTDVIYNRETCLIEKIKPLKYDDKTYSIAKLSEVKKSKSASKSRSNIDRFIRNN